MFGVELIGGFVVIDFQFDIRYRSERS